MALRQLLAALLSALLEWLSSLVRPRSPHQPPSLLPVLEYNRVQQIHHRLRQLQFQHKLSKLVLQASARVARSRLQASVSAWVQQQLQAVQQSPLERLSLWLHRQLSRLLQPSLVQRQRYTKEFKQSPAPARWWSQGQSNGLKNQRPRLLMPSNPLPQQIGQHNQTLPQVGARQLKG